MIVIGITGGTGCGKTTALSALERLGGRICDADALYHGLLKTDKALLSEIEQAFPGVVEQGELQRKKLGAVVFHDPAALERLGAVTGPYILRAIADWLERQRAEGAPAAAIDAISLMEGPIAGWCDTTVAITAPEEVRVRRLMARDQITEEYARSRIAAQKSNEEFSAMCRYTLYNDCASAEEFGQKSEALFRKILGRQTDE